MTDDETRTTQDARAERDAPVERPARTYGPAEPEGRAATEDRAATSEGSGEPESRPEGEEERGEPEPEALEGTRPDPEEPREVPAPRAASIPRATDGSEATDATESRAAEAPTSSENARTYAGERPQTYADPQTYAEEDARPHAQEERLTGRQQLVAHLWPPRVSRAQLIVALLLFVLGLGLAIQVRSTSDNSALRGARQEDLVRLLDELDNRTQRLEDEKRRLENQRTELENSSDQADEARKQTLQKEQQLGVLAGTVRAQGPGITLTVNDSKGSVEGDMLLDAIQELRAAGAEAIQINDVRVVAGTYFSDSSGGVRIDGRRVSAPYRFKVIGRPQDLEPALNIPGGVVQTLEKEQATVSIERAEKIVVDALRPAQPPDYARSSSR